MLRHYLITALRNFWRFRLTTTVNLVGLALGLTCFVATFVFLHSLLQSDMHYPKAARTYVLTQELWVNLTERMVPSYPMSAPPAAKYLRADFPALEAVARALPLGSLAAAADERKLSLSGAAVDPSFVRIFDLPFLRGDPYTSLSGMHSLVLTQSAAERLFGTVDVIGRHVILQNNVDVAITGVLGRLRQPSHMGDGEQAQLRFDLLLPMDLLKTLQSTTMFGTVSDPDMDLWGTDVYFTYALLPADGSLTAPQFLERLKSFGARHVPKDQLISIFGAVPISHLTLSTLDALFGGKAVSVTTAVFLLDALILVIACLNYANLAVAIASTRAREIGLRKVLGASGLHLTGQHAVEAGLLGSSALVLVLIGTALAVGPLNTALGLDLDVHSFRSPRLWLLVIGLIAGVCAIGGALPALLLARVRPVQSLRAEAVHVGPRFMPTVLVGIQFAAAGFLLVMTLLITDQNRTLQRWGSAAGRDPLVVIKNDTRQLNVDFNTLRSELLTDPSIKSVSAVIAEPWTDGGWHFFLRRNAEAASSPVTTIINPVSYDFFATFDIPVLAGRAFDREHGDEVSIYRLSQSGSATLKVVIDRSLARELGWPNPNQAVGKIIQDWSPEGMPSNSFQVIGVAEDGYPRLIGPNTDSNLYVLSPDDARVPAVRIAADNVRSALGHIDAVWERLAPRAPLIRHFSDELFEQSYEKFSIASRVLAGLAMFAFIIALMGLFGMAIHVTSRRRREIGIRKTLGAAMPRVVGMLLADFSKPIVLANLIAWPLALVAGRYYLELFVQRAPLSPWPFIASLVLTVLIAALAVAGQALRAAAVKPAAVLRVA